MSQPGAPECRPHGRRRQRQRDCPPTPAAPARRVTAAPAPPKPRLACGTGRVSRFRRHTSLLVRWTGHSFFMARLACSQASSSAALPRRISKHAGPAASVQSNCTHHHLRLSLKARLPMTPRPSTPTYTTVAGDAACLSSCAAPESASAAAAGSTTPSTHSRRPTCTWKNSETLMYAGWIDQIHSEISH